MDVFVFATAVSSCGAPVWLPRPPPVVVSRCAYCREDPRQFLRPETLEILAISANARARVSGLGISKALGQKWGLYKIENQAVQASNTFQHHLYKIENQAALENTNIPQLSKKNLYKIMPKQNDVFFFVFFFFPSADFYFLEEVRVQSGTPAPARERVAVRYFVEEMITGIMRAHMREHM